MSNSRDKTLLAPNFASEFVNLGIDVFDYIQSDYFDDLTTLKKIFHKVNPSYFYKNINKKLLEQVSNIKPDVLLIFKGMETFPETLKIIKSYGIKVVNYNPDHPFDYLSKGSGNNNVLNSIPIYDLHICYSRKIAKDLERKYPTIRTSILPFGYALTEVEYNGILNEEEVNKVCFVGFADKERADFIGNLKQHGYHVDVYGSNWDRYFSKSDQFVSIYKSVSGLEYYKTLRKYRVQLNILRKHNEDSHNMRSFEVPAAGGIMLAPCTSEHSSFFKNEDEAFFYDSKEMMFNYLNYLLSLPNEEANIIRKNARFRSIDSKYDYPSRAKELHQILTNL